jgi:diguanylate cyclase (GGDEF)-like protein
MDLDGFKRVNAELGHAAGDDVLRSVAGVLRLCIRQADIAARVGGDEFCLLLSDATIVSTRIVADRVLRGLQALALVLPTGAAVGASFGIATDRDGRNPPDVVAAADGAMYRAKRQGGDRIAQAGEERTEARTPASV